MPTIVHFDIGADDTSRAKAFYGTLFGWEMTSPPGMDQYMLIETKDLEGKPGPGGGLAKRDDPSQPIVMYIGVDDMERYLAESEKLGGKVVMPKMAVPGWGYTALCMDTEGNQFGLWQDDSNAA